MLKKFGLGDLSNIDLNDLVLIFLVEELLFRLDDTGIPNLKEPSKGLIHFLDEVRAVKFEN